MLINLKKIFFNKIFDENFFLFCEETDLCKRIKDLGDKIFVVTNAKAMLTPNGASAFKQKLT